MAKSRTVLFVCAVVCAVASPANAQRWGRERVPQDGVCFYKDVNFEGDYFCARPGDTFSTLPFGLNNRIASIRFFGKAEVTVFQDSRYEGRSSRFESSVKNLKDEGWADEISSIRVRPTPDAARPVVRPADEPERIIRRAYEDILDREPDQAGLRQYRSRMIDDGWTEAQVRDALRKSPEYHDKNAMTQPKAQEIVRKAYLAVLKREPDPDSKGYVERVMRDHWTQADVERELKKSVEYKRKGG